MFVEDYAFLLTMSKREPEILHVYKGIQQKSKQYSVFHNSWKIFENVFGRRYRNK